MKLSFLEDLFPSFILDAFELAFAGRFASTTPRQINFDFGIDSMSLGSVSQIRNMLLLSGWSLRNGNKKRVMLIHMVVSPCCIDTRFQNQIKSSRGVAGNGPGPQVVGMATVCTSKKPVRPLS